MGERTDPVEQDEVEVARTHIEETRAEMSETIDAIQDKLSPEHLKEQAKETVKQATVGKATEVFNTARGKSTEVADNLSNTARTAGYGVTRTVKQKPFPIAATAIAFVGLLAAAQLIWMLRRRSQQSAPQRYADSASQALSQFQRVVGQVAEQARGTAARAASQGQAWTRSWGATSLGPDRTAPGPSSAPLFDAPLTMVDLAAGAAVTLTLAARRRLQRSSWWQKP